MKIHQETLINAFTIIFQDGEYIFLINILILIDLIFIIIYCD